MNTKFLIICTIIVLALGGSALADNNNNNTVLVHGTAYNWDTLEPLKNVIIYVNSTPSQSWVAKNGTYSFELLPGNYTITANYYQNNILTYSVEETIQIIDEGNGASYIYDLMLLPVYSEKPNIGSNINGLDKNNYYNKTYLQIGFAFILLATVYIFYRKYKYSGKRAPVQEEIKNNSSNNFKTKVEEFSQVENLIEEPVHNSEIHSSSLKTKLPLPPELQEVINVIRANRGRIAQKDLRAKLKQSEVKVSLMLSDLEKRGLIEKFKSGRENIVILIDENL